MKLSLKLALCGMAIFFIFSCKKDKLNTDSGAKVYFSKDSVFFDTVFTSIGSSTRNIRVRNTSKQRIKISSIYLLGGTNSPYVLNVDGTSGKSFSDVEIAADDSIYVFIQVNINPNNANSPLIVADAIHFIVNGKQQVVNLEAWGQDAYYHRPTRSINFRDGNYLPYSLCDEVKRAVVDSNELVNIVWKNDKPHVIYGYCVVDEGQKLKIQAGTRIYLNSRASLWVYQDGELQVLGQKGNEVIFQGARRERTLSGTLSGIDLDYNAEPGQWDRIWINEGSVNNRIDYAIIKNGYIGIQAELFSLNDSVPRGLEVTNTRIENMSLWGLYTFAFNVRGANNVISNCKEHCVNIAMGGFYSFRHCTFSNFWSKDARDKPTVNINNYSETQEIPLYCNFGNCIIDGKLTNELNLDVKTAETPTVVFSNNWIKTDSDLSDANRFINVRKGSTSLKYKDTEKYNFEPDNENEMRGFVHPKATSDALLVPTDIKGTARNTTSVTAGAYE